MVIGLREGSAVVILLACWAFWNIFFSPMYGTMGALSLTLGLILLPKTSRHVLDVGQPDPRQWWHDARASRPRPRPRQAA